MVIIVINVVAIIIVYSHLLTLGLVRYRVSTFATIVDHTFLSAVIVSSRPCSLMSLLILSIHLMRGLPLGLFPGISISNTVLVMSSGYLSYLIVITINTPFHIVHLFASKRLRDYRCVGLLDKCVATMYRVFLPVIAGVGVYSSAG